MGGELWDFLDSLFVMLGWNRDGSFQPTWQFAVLLMLIGLILTVSFSSN